MLQHHTPGSHHAVAALLQHGGQNGGASIGRRKAALDFMLADQPERARAALELLLKTGDRRGTTLAAYIVCLSRTGDGFRARTLLEALQRSNQDSPGMTDLLSAVAVQLERERFASCRAAGALNAADGQRGFADRVAAI